MIERHPAAITTLRPPPFEHLFVATDFSPGAAHAIARAGHVPLADGARITVVHVLSDSVPERAREAAETLARRHLARAAKALLSTTRRSRRAVRTSTELCRGQAYVEIIRHARSAGADLIVLGRHGLRRLRDMFIGSTAERVIRAAGLPVLVVSRKPNRAYRSPIIAVDLEDTCRSVISDAVRVLGPEVATATMVHAFHVPFEGFMTSGVSSETMTDIRKEYRQAASSGIAKLRATLGDLGVRWQTVVVRGDPRSAVVAEAARRRADLVVVGTHGRTGFSHALIGSVAEHVIQAAPCDVLVARPARVSFELP